MKLMSEGLQRVAGERLKALLGKMTANRFAGVLTGLGITSVIQSSSATTVMVVSFVSAGLLTLSQAIGVIMGANIGTTMTGWIVSLLGFKVKISAFALPAVGLGMMLTFARAQMKKDWGDTLLGFGLLFLGIGLLKDSIPPIEGPEQLTWIQGLVGHGFLSTLIFVGIGTAITLVLQSSSATMTLTLTMAALGWLPYEAAVAMVLGENIGTTATANLAAIGASTDAKRAARVHLLFNLIGVAWALVLMHVYLLPAVDALVPGNPLVDFNSLQGDKAALAVASGVVTTHLAAVHTIFNVTNTLLMLPLVKQLETIVRKWVPDRAEKKEPSKLRYLQQPGMVPETPELLLVQAGQEMQHMTEVARTMFRDALSILTQPTAKLGKQVEKTLALEEEIDELEREIRVTLTLSTSTGTTNAFAQRVADMMENTHRLERIGDHCAALVRIARRNYEAHTTFGADDVADLQRLGTLVDDALANLGRYLAGQGGETARLSEELEGRVDATRRELRTRHIELVKQTTEGVDGLVTFLDAIAHLEEVADRVVGIIRRSEATRRSAAAAA